MPPSWERDQERVQEAGNVNECRVNLHAGSRDALLCAFNSEPWAYSSACPWGGAAALPLSGQIPNPAASVLGRASKVFPAKVGWSRGICWFWEGRSPVLCVSGVVAKACWYPGNCLPRGQMSPGRAPARGRRCPAAGHLPVGRRFGLGAPGLGWSKGFFRKSWRYQGKCQPRRFGVTSKMI